MMRHLVVFCVFTAWRVAAQIAPTTFEEAIECIRAHDIASGVCCVMSPLGDIQEFIIDGSEAECFLREGKICSSGLLLERYPDAWCEYRVMPDWQTVSLIPQAEGLWKLVCIGQVRQDGVCECSDARAILHKVIEELLCSGYLCKVRGDLICEVTGSAGQPSILSGDRLLQVLQEVGCLVDSVHHQLGESVYVISFKECRLCQFADQLVQLRLASSILREKYNTVMTFPERALSGCGGSALRIYVALVDACEEQDLFFDELDPYRLSDQARMFIAGVMQAAPDCALLWAGRYDMYGRCKVPACIGWGFQRRNGLINVVVGSPAGVTKNWIELRCVDPRMNSYLACAAFVKAGLEGIRRGILPCDPLRPDISWISPEESARCGIRVMPFSFEQALSLARESDFLCNWLGKYAGRYIDCAYELWRNGQELQW